MAVPTVDHSHPAYAQTALDVLKRQGYRITRQRRLLVELLEETETPLSAYEIKDKLDEKGEKIDTVSIYRILACLEEHQLIHRVLHSGKVLKCQLEHESHCHKETDSHCHHFLTCDACGGVEEIHCIGVETLAEQVTRQAGFKVRSHNLEFFGVCQRCQQKGTI